MSTTTPRFILIGENIHTTRVLNRKNERIAPNENGEEGITFSNEDGALSHLRISEVEKGGGACPHCGSERVTQLVAAFSAVTSRKS